jgi:hypothetical protein
LGDFFANSTGHRASLCYFWQFFGLKMLHFRLSQGNQMF